MNLRLLVACLIAAALVACGGGGGSSGGSSSSGGGTSVDPNDRAKLVASGETVPVPSYHNTDLDFVVSNPSATTAATDVVLAVTLGNGLSRAGLSCASLGGGALCPANSDSMTVASLPAGGSLRFRMSVIVAGGTTGAITTTASVTAANDLTTTNNNASINLTAYSADINIVGSTSATQFAAGSLVPYSITVSNSGPDAARDVQLENILSTGQVISSITCVASGGATCPASPSANMTIPSLPSGGALALTVNSQLSTNVLVSVSNTLRATLLGDANFGNNAVTVSADSRLSTSPTTPSFIVLQSDTNDWVGGGSNYSYSNANAVFEVYVAQDALWVKTAGDQTWQALFYPPIVMGQLVPGRYAETLQNSTDPFAPRFNWSGESRGCSSSGWFSIDNVVYTAGMLTAVDLRFEQHCDAGPSALRGQVHWVANDATVPPGPINPPPADLWHPAAGVTPASGNFLYFESDANDFIGRGSTQIFTQADSILTVSNESGVLGIGANGDTQFSGEFKQMAPGYYPNAHRYPFGNPAAGRMGFSGDGRGCNYISGWFVIDNIAFNGDAIIALDMRFEQHCEGDTPALRGQVHWRSNDPTQPAGPVVPPPAGLWAPAAAAVPASGNVVYLEGEPGEFIAGGLSKTYTPLDSIITVGAGGMTPVGNRFQLTVKGDQEWTGYFQAMNTLPDVRAGYYGNLLRFPFNNPTKGGLDWSGEGRGCNELSGWFVVDSIAYTGSSVTAITLRFEQHCEFGAKALHGYIRWSAADTRQPVPPQNPPPSNLWQPPAGATPATGNYYYQESDVGSWVGQGETHLHTSLDALFEMTVSGNQLNVLVEGEKRWSGYFAPMVPLTRLQVGYYGNLTGQNPTRGMAYWGGDGRACGGTYGWFAVDDVTYNPDGSLAAITLRFQHSCSADEAPLWGKLHWRADDSQHPSAPQLPVPTTLWKPPAGAVPATGDYFYIQSEPGDFVGSGKTKLFAGAGWIFQGGTVMKEVIVGVQDSANFWSAVFTPMFVIPRLQPGYYPAVHGTLGGNPARGGLDVSGDGHGCNEIDGWFVIDSITWTGDAMTGLEARWEQHCEGAPAALRGSLRWTQ